MAKFERDANCGCVGKEHIDKEITLAGWVASNRDQGGVLFVDLRDRSGKVQVVFDREEDSELHEAANHLKSEFVIQVTGIVRERSEETVNPNLETGHIEVVANKIKVLNTCKVLPFQIEANEDLHEDIRLRHRYLDIRRPGMMKNLIFRHKVAKVARDYLDNNGFLEVETPVLTKSTPEGARDYLVPSRVHDGEFYALPQSPQLFKQLLQVSGVEKYFQLAKCFRDEDLRADRQPEHTQVDIEMSFVDVDDILELIEGMVSEIFEKTLDTQIKTPFQRIPYSEAMLKYGSDKPDLRFECIIQDVAECLQDVEFNVFKSVLKNKGAIRMMVGPGCAEMSIKDMNDLTDFVKIYGAKGLAWIKVLANDEFKSPIVKFFTQEKLMELKELGGAKEGDVMFFVADKEKVANQAMGALRLKIGEIKGLIDQEAYRFAWVVDFPMFEYDEDEERYFAVHHPFTCPLEEDINYLEEDPSKVRARAYDLVLNGVEMGGGSIRIHEEAVQDKMFKALSMDSETAKEQFGFLLNALKFGAPPHGGIALGLDRMVMLLLKLKTIRDTIAFPKTQKASCLMTDSPSRVSEKQLRELHIKLRNG